MTDWSDAKAFYIVLGFLLVVVVVLLIIICILCCKKKGKKKANKLVTGNGSESGPNDSSLSGISSSAIQSSMIGSGLSGLSGISSARMSSAKGMVSEGFEVRGVSSTTGPKSQVSGSTSQSEMGSRPTDLKYQPKEDPKSQESAKSTTSTTEQTNPSPQ